MSEVLEYFAVPPELVALSARASEHWAMSSTRNAAGSVVGGAVQDFTNGSTQTQIASFSVPRLPDADPRDPADMQAANAAFAVACVEWVRSLIARNEAGRVGVAALPRKGVLAVFADHAEGIEAAHKSARGKNREAVALGLSEFRGACYSVAELIEADKESDAANAAWHLLEGERRQRPGAEYQRARTADARRARAIAHVEGDL